MPNQLVPLATKVRISTAEAVAVIVGAVPAGNFTDVNTAVPLPPDAWVTISMNDLPAVAVGIVNVQAVDAVNVTV